MPRAPARRARRPLATRRVARRPPPATAPPAPTPPLVPPEATAHAICRGCGRILRVPIPPAELAVLQSFTDRRPDGWVVQGMSFSFTGFCPACQGRRA